MNNIPQYKTEKEFLEKYNPNDYNTLSLAVDIVLMTTSKNKTKIVLTKRNEHPFKDKWSLPGTFVKPNETTEDAVNRCLHEKLGIESAYIEQLYTFSKIDRDPRMRIVSVSYIAIIPYPDLIKNKKLELFEEQSKEQLINPNASNKKTGLFDCYTDILNDIDNLGFDHGEIVRTALTRIANKIEYTDIAFEFLPDKNEFTLSELCEIYIAIGAKPNYDIPNLRRFIKKRYIDTKKIIITGNKKPAKGVKPATYSLNKNL